MPAKYFPYVAVLDIEIDHYSQVRSQDFQKESYIDVESVCIHNRVRLWASGGMLPKDIFRETTCSEIASEAILRQKQSSSIAT